MKKSLMMICALVLTMLAQAKDHIYDRPAFKSASWSACPVKVEIGKKVTAVHFKMRCASMRSWSMEGARLECDGQRYAFKEGRILTHDGAKVLVDEPFEIGKKYEQNAQQDSVILFFEPLPKNAKTFDYIENDNEGAWRAYGIRLDNQLYPSIFPHYQPPVDNGEPLKPLKLKYGEATGTFTLHGGGSFSYFGDYSRDPITWQYESKSQYGDSTLIYCHPAYVTTHPHFLGCKVDASMVTDQFPLILVPGETLTLEVDGIACTARDNDFAAGKPANRDCYRVGGTMGDLAQVILENEYLYYRYIEEIPSYTGQTFAEWRDELWNNLDALRHNVQKRNAYTHRQQDFWRLLLESYYVGSLQGYQKIIAGKMKLQNPDSVLAPLKGTFTLVDPHAKDLMLFRDGRTYYLPFYPNQIPYLEANGLDHGEVYEMLKGFAEAQKVGMNMRQGEVQSDSVIQALHPYFQPVVRAFNDTTRVHLECLRREAKDRMMPTPNVSSDQLLQSIASQHPGKVVFFDLWATWCGPCMKGIQAMEPMKEQLKDQDVVFVYLTNESSPIDQWSEQVIRIHGLHYRIPNILWTEIPGFDGGIPQYYLYDSQGHRIWEHTGFGNNTLEVIAEEIEKTIK